jgi:hypothetical protein
MRIERICTLNCWYINIGFFTTVSVMKALTSAKASSPIFDTVTRRAKVLWNVLTLKYLQTVFSALIEVIYYCTVRAAGSEIKSRRRLSALT